MNKAAFDEIIEFCNKHNDFFLTDIEKNYVIKSVLDSYYNTIEKHKKSNGANPTPDEERAMMSTLLEKATLSNFAVSANKHYQQIKSNHENEFRKTLKETTSGWKSFFIAIAANLAYSLLLALLFFVAKDNIRELLNKLDYTATIENQANDKPK